MEYLPFKDIDFTSSKGKKHKLDELINGNSPNQGTISSKSTVTPSNEDYESLYENLSKSGTKPAILSILSEYSDPYIPKRMLSPFPQSLPQLHKPEYIETGYLDLLEFCESQDVTLIN